MSIADGIVVESVEGNIGFRSGSTGAVTIDGVGSTWTCSGDFYIGLEGNGTLEITNGAAAHSNKTQIGYDMGTTAGVTVNGAGSTWTNDRNLYVGNGGSATLNITAGGTVSNGGRGYIGNYSGSMGAVTVDGTGSILTNGGDLQIGHSGDGDVDGVDFLDWQLNDGSASNLTVWQENYGNSSLAVTATIPEPDALLLSVLTAVGLLALRWSL